MKEFKGRSTIKIYNADCMEYMKDMKDNQFDLAIVDPPYGIGAGNKGFINRNTANKNAEKFYRDNDWDKIRPNKVYFDKLNEVSKNQIIWGGNYFVDLLKPARCYIVWDKKTGDNSYADCELALTNINSNAKIYTKFWLGAHAKDESKRIHPTQKPVQLYKWLLQNYAKEGDTILDTHLGSGSIAIACWDLGFDLTAFEIDKDYFNDACNRIELHTRQEQMYPPEEIKQPEQTNLF
jgi:site-specific DNA-methyltransferase (adenine-specific)